ncbi:hypothetical protein VIBNIFTn2_120191 [Vibrio nigripulchritudo FTn2]|uniref:hypothetical protein n=1 Tax=Vibrio nigripulchritudo TaxID=28173 RepID=UPI0003B1F773|nr:hypothetical protein [Vibrio nigripulchritudo]CCN40209.1 hypothetical protein VIBNIFTn2_120191 [Vibrio nigripulchritudo FTn2]
MIELQTEQDFENALSELTEYGDHPLGELPEYQPRIQALKKALSVYGFDIENFRKDIPTSKR